MALASCSPKLYPVEHTDSVRVVIRERVVHDSVFFEVPKVVEKNITRDTVSHLENEWAKSDASVSGGFLRHSLESIPRKVYVPYNVYVHDTTVVEKKADTIVKEVNILTKGQQRWMTMGKVFLGISIALVLALAALVFIKIRKVL